MSSEHYEIFAIRYASFQARTRRESFLGIDPHDQVPHPIDYFVWLVRNSRRTVLVDTGFDHAEAAARGRKIERLPREGLAMLGIDPGSITDVIVTHLHYDHAGTTDDFPNACFHLQEVEMAYATGPCMTHQILAHPYSCDHVVSLVRKVFEKRVRFHDGDKEIFPGISVHLIGGHAKGIQVVRVATDIGPVVIASDATHYYENFLEYRPFIIVHDVEATLRGYDRLRILAGGTDRVIPGHDPLIMKRYSAPEARFAGMIVKLDVLPENR